MDCNASGAMTPTSPLLPSISRTGRDTTTSRLPSTWMILISSLQVRLLCQRGTTRFQHRSLLHIEMEPSPWSGFASTYMVEKPEIRPWKTVAEPVADTSLYGQTDKPH